MLFVRGVYILVSTRLREGVKWTCADCSNCANKNESAIQLRAGELHDMCGSSHSGSQYSLLAVYMVATPDREEHFALLLLQQPA